MKALMLLLGTLNLALLVMPISLHAEALTLGDVLDRVPELDSNIPTPEETVRLKVGERHWYHHEIIRYLDALAETSPRMVALGAHATSYGGRDLISYAISSPENIEKLEAIKANRQAIIDPKAKISLDDQPAVMHMMYSVHGNEPSGANSMPLVAYYLTAAKDAALEAQLDDVVIIFNPMLNPDGLDRFAHWSNSLRGLNPSPDANDREHREAVPNGRTNYYWFDLNRDWLPHQHPESRGRLALFHEWKPNVQLDFHEQGNNSNFFFMPGKPERTNPLTPAINQELTAKIGEFHAKTFDEDGILYFTEEGYDDFFMGKGSTYPDLFGCVGILFEQPSSRGAQQKGINGLLTFPNSIANQFRASLSSLEATASLKSELLNYQRNFYTENQRKNGSGYFLAAAEGDPTRLREFVRVLRGHDIVVEVLSNDVTAEGQLYKAGQTLAIPLDQAQSTYLLTLWNHQLEFEENVFYDVSTWTMPWAFNMTHTREAVRNAKTESLPDDFLMTSSQLASSPIGYLIDWRDSQVPALLYKLLEADANVRVAQKPFTANTLNQGAVDFSYGTLFVAPNIGEAIPADALTLLQSAALSGTPVYPVASSLTSRGIDLGSRDFHVLSLPKVLMVTGAYTSPYQTGEIWHLLDRRLQMPLTMVDSTRLARVDLGDYTHIILTNPLSALPDKVSEKIDVFVKGGGILWAQGDTTLTWLQSKGLTDMLWRKTDRDTARAQLKEKRGDDNTATDEIEALLPARAPFAQADDTAAFRLVRGAILEGLIDTTHPLGYGYTHESLPVFRRNATFMARSENPYSTPILYSAAPLLSGYMSVENRALAANSAGMIVDAKGDGAIVLTLDSATFRAFWWGTQKLLINTIFFGELLEEPRE